MKRRVVSVILMLLMAVGYGTFLHFYEKEDTESGSCRESFGKPDFGGVPFDECSPFLGKPPGQHQLLLRRKSCLPH